MAVTNSYGAGKTYIKIASQTLAATSSTVTFSNIPQGYTDLRIVVVGNQYTSASYGDFNMRFNSDSGSNYSYYAMYSNTTNGTTPIANAYAANQTSFNVGKMVDFTAGNLTWVSNSIIDIFSYTNTNAHKTILISNSMINSTDYSYVAKFVETWRNTSAVTTISFHAISDPPFNVGTSFIIYGIKAATRPQAVGGSITTDGTYWIHTFTSSGLFIPQQFIDNVDYLVVAGGGSGAAYYGGGGGAGGLRSTVTNTGGGGSLESKLSLSAGNYVVVVGAGGSAVTGQNVQGNQGSNSIFGLITSTGGGFGSKDSGSGGDGGSGGGGGASGARGLGTSGQGYNGGTGGNFGSNDSTGGGGGGAGAVGSNGIAYVGGNGGNGVSSSISGSSVTYAGGGGGGTGVAGTTAGSGGSGGGGAGSKTTATATSGTANTGGGGGGSANGGGGTNTTSGAGGSGIVIVRYPV